MKPSLIDRLTARIIELKSPILVGIDPQLAKLPRPLVDEQIKRYGDTTRAHAAAFLAFNRAVIDAVEGLTAAVKPQIAFYEELGTAGLAVYAETCAYARSKGLFVVADAKRGDIGSTSAAYAAAFLSDLPDCRSEGTGSSCCGSGQGARSAGAESERFFSDFLTVNPYLGDDCLREFVAAIDRNDKGMFVLVKTSNPSSSQLQDLVLADCGRTVYEAVADMVEAWSAPRAGSCGLSAIGAVVGATHPVQLAALRKRMPTSLFLVPGYGAQGGAAQDVVPALRPDFSGALINSSRGIIFAPAKDGEPFTAAIRRAAQAMRDDIAAAMAGGDR